MVRLRQGDYNLMTVYSSDPVETAKGFLYAGSACMHVVDLDGAKEGSPQNREVIRKLCKLPLEIEVGGAAIRDERTIKDFLSMGVQRVILGSVAVEDFAFTERMGKRYGDKLAAGVDTKDGRVAIHGMDQRFRSGGLCVLPKVARCGDIHRDLHRHCQGRLAGRHQPCRL